MIKSKVDVQEIFLAVAREEIKSEYNIERKKREKFDWRKRQPEGPACPMIINYTDKVN